MNKLPNQQDLEEAKYRGQHAGNLLLGRSMNPYDHCKSLTLAWDNARLLASYRRITSSR